MRENSNHARLLATLPASIRSYLLTILPEGEEITWLGTARVGLFSRLFKAPQNQVSEKYYLVTTRRLFVLKTEPTLQVVDYTPELSQVASRWQDLNIVAEAGDKQVLIIPHPKSGTFRLYFLNLRDVNGLAEAIKELCQTLERPKIQKFDRLPNSGWGLPNATAWPQVSALPANPNLQNYERVASLLQAQSYQRLINVLQQILLKAANDPSPRPDGPASSGGWPLPPT